MLIGLADDEPDFDPVTASQLGVSAPVGALQTLLKKKTFGLPAWTPEATEAVNKRVGPCRPGVDPGCQAPSPDRLLWKISRAVGMEPKTFVYTAAAIALAGAGYYALGGGRR
jgi:hypothetical protein